MPVLHIRNVPEELCERLRTLARRERRSVNAEVIGLLAKAVEPEDHQSSLVDTLHRAREIRSSLTKAPRRGPGSLSLLHSGRRERNG
jgi:plasmid stability protein